MSHVAIAARNKLFVVVSVWGVNANSVYTYPIIQYTNIYIYIILHVVPEVLFACLSTDFRLKAFPFDCTNDLGFVYGVLFT